MNQPLIIPCSQCDPSFNCWSGAVECRKMERFETPKNRLAWGSEEMGERIYVGPMRADGSKLSEIAFSIDITGYHAAAQKRHRETADMIVTAMNYWLSFSSNDPTAS